MIQGFGDFFLFLGGCFGCGEDTGCSVGAGPGFRCVIFLSANQYKNQNMKLNKK